MRFAGALPQSLNFTPSQTLSARRPAAPLRPQHLQVQRRVNVTPTKEAVTAPRELDRRAAENMLPETQYSGTDDRKEEERALSRSQFSFTFDSWTAHRSSTRYVRHMLGIFQSSIVRDLAQPLSCVAAVSIGVACYEDLLAMGSLPEGYPSFLMPTAPFDLTSTALGLLLVFRTNTSYDRFLEASTVWAGLGNRARDTMRQVISHLSDSTGTISPLAAAMCRWVVAYSYTLKAQITEPSKVNLSAELAEVLTPLELTQLLSSHHAPSFALSVLTELGAAAPLRESHRIRLDENLTFFEDASGTCERILRTPIPLSYSRHTSRFMVIWLTALPLGLYSTCGWATVPLCLTIAFLLLGIDELGVQIEEPFGLLPLDDMCAEIESDLYMLLREALTAKRTAAAAAAAAMGHLKLGDEGENGTELNGAAPFSPLPSGAKRGSISTHREWSEIHKTM